jgi:Domain of unknown function (DUF6457)
VNEFFEDLGRRWVEVAARRGVEIDQPLLDSDLAAELLELARVAAHTQERRFAPLASFMAGVAVERLRAASEPSGTQLSSGELAAYVREVRQELEPEAPA